MDNIYDQLSDVMLKPNGGTLLLGDHSDVVLNALGSPNQISYINPYKWIYNNSYVEFNKAWEVIGWTNIYDQLSDVMLEPNGGTLLLGDHSDSVLNALGSPNQISYINPYKWTYNNSYVEFNKAWEVIGWTNIYDQLAEVMLEPKGGTIQLGSNVESVIDAFGSPTQISYLNSYKWIYKNSSIEFSKDWKVVGWHNIYDQLTNGLVSLNGSSFEIGSTSDEVLSALGGPTQISYLNPYKWIYKNSYVLFNKQWEVKEWQNNYDQLSHGFKTSE